MPTYDPRIPHLPQMSSAEVDAVVRRIMRRRKDITYDQLEQSFRRSTYSSGIVVRHLLERSLGRLAHRRIIEQRVVYRPRVA